MPNETNDEFKNIQNWENLERTHLGVVLPSGRIWPHVLINTLDVSDIDEAETILDDIDANRKTSLKKLQPQTSSTIVSRNVTPFVAVSRKENAPVISWQALAQTRNLLRMHKRAQKQIQNQILSEKYPPQRPEPDPNVVRMEFEEMFGSMAAPGRTDRFVRIRSHNGEFVDVTKADKFMNSYQLLISTAAITTMQEIAPDAVKEIAEKAATQRYGHFSTPDNGRGQAVGILIHWHYEVVEHGVWYDVADVGGIQHLRPAPWVKLKHRFKGFEFVLTSVHLKSNIGGRSATRKVRLEQVKRLVKHLELHLNVPCIVTGDVNCLVGTNPASEELQPLYDAGFKLLGADNNNPTHISKRRIDAIWYRGEAEMTDYVIYDIYQTNLSDHDAIEGRLPLPARKKKATAKKTGKKSKSSCDTKVEIAEGKSSRKRAAKFPPEIRLKPIRNLDK